MPVSAHAAAAHAGPAPPVAAIAEQAGTFNCGGDTLLAVISTPPGPSPLGVLVIVGGPQYRAGSHRQFTLLARALAREGVATMRFDVRGMGDSSGQARSFEALGDDIAAALDHFCRRQPGLQRVVLWGLCDGASAALLYLQQRADPRVAGLVLVNPWVRSEASQARTQVKHYYRQRLMQRAFWAKLFSGRVALSALGGLWRNLRQALAPGKAAPAGGSYQQRMAQAWTQFQGPVLLVLSENDYTAREFEEFIAADPAWRGALQRPGLQVHRAASADHTFSSQAQRQSLEVVTARWLDALR